MAKHNGAKPPWRGVSQEVSTMEATAETVETAEEEARPTVAAATATTRKLFEYSRYIHVGEGAETCEHTRDGDCVDPGHFHAWCRLPNPLQNQDIREKGLAAKARRTRLLRDPASDAHAVMEDEIALLADSQYVESVIDDLLGRDWAGDYSDAVIEVNDLAEYEHIQQDREEYGRLIAAQAGLPEDEQTDEFKHLNRHVIAYLNAITETLKRIQEPRRIEYRQRPYDDLLQLLREKRIEEEANRYFIDVYNSWLWLVGTFQVKPDSIRGRPFKRMWVVLGDRDRPESGTMLAEAPEVIEALRDTYGKLSQNLQAGSAGN